MKISSFRAKAAGMADISADWMQLRAIAVSEICAADVSGAVAVAVSR
jgi:hypothetical protein